MLGENLTRSWTPNGRIRNGEFDVNADGSEVLKKVSREYVDELKLRRERWEFVFKVISALGIVVTLIGIWVNVRNQKRQIDSQATRQREEYDNRVYQNALRDVFIVNRVDADDSSREVATNDYLTEVLPTLYLVSNEPIRENLHAIAMRLSDVKQYEALRGFLYYIRDATGNIALAAQDSLIQFDSYKYGFKAVTNAMLWLSRDSLRSISPYLRQDHQDAIGYSLQLAKEIREISDSASHVEFLMNDADLEILGAPEIASVRSLYYQSTAMIQSLIYVEKKYRQSLAALQDAVAGSDEPPEFHLAPDRGR